jgi:hypothetical protein
MFYGVSSDLMGVRRELLPFLHPFSPGFGARGDEECSVKAVLLENRTDVVEMSRHRIIKSEGDDGRAITGPGSHRQRSSGLGRAEGAEKENESTDQQPDFRITAQAASTWAKPPKALTRWLL